MSSKSSDNASTIYDTLTKQISLKEKKFAGLLDDIDSVDDNVKELWREIYDNANADRQAAYTLYQNLLPEVMASAEGHMIHGGTMSKYLERVNKANDQLLKLAEQIEKAKTKSEGIDQNDIFSQIEGGSH